MAGRIIKKNALTPAQRRLLRDALDACRAAEHSSRRRVDPSEYSANVTPLPGPTDERRALAMSDAALALLYAGIAHDLTHPGQRPKTMMWLGHRWHLVVHASGDFEVQAYPGVPGVISVPMAWPAASLERSAR